MNLGSWVVVLSSIIIFLTLLGLPTGLTPILTSIGVTINPLTEEFTADVQQSSLYNEVFGVAGILTLIIGGAVAIGLFARGYDPSLVIAPFLVFIGVLFLGTFWSIIKLMDSYGQWWMTSIVGLIFAVLSLGFIMEIVAFFRR